MTSSIPPLHLAIQNLSKKFGKHFAVDQANWQATHGQIICLLGHSGCGKTTMLRLIAGLESPTDGSIELAQKVLWNQTQDIPAENRNIGLVFQDYALFPHLTIHENIRFGLNTLDKQSQNLIVDEVLSHVSLTQHADKYPHMLSGGEQQRVALARALAPKPDVLLMDEPFSNLDRRLRDRIRQNTIDILRTTGSTTVIVTHDPEEALQIADQIILMHQGKIIQIGSPQQLYQQPNSLFSAEYFSILNKIPCTLHNQQLHSICGQLSYTITDTSIITPTHKHQNYWYCFRPYQIELSVEPPQQQSQYPSFTGTVLSTNYLGHQQALTLQITGSDAIIHTQGVYDFLPQIGQQCYAHIHGNMFIFPIDSKDHDIH